MIDTEYENSRFSPTDGNTYKEEKSIVSNAHHKMATVSAKRFFKLN